VFSTAANSTVTSNTTTARILTSGQYFLVEHVERVAPAVLLSHGHIVPRRELLGGEAESGAEVVHGDVTQGLHALLLLHGRLETVQQQCALQAETGNDLV
jgi:hypothetical protein